MASNVDMIYARLMADATLVGILSGGNYTGTLSGGVWTRRLKREGAQATSLAFDSNKAKLIRFTATIVDFGDEDHPQELSIPTAYEQEVRIYIYGLATQTGKERIKVARKRIHSLLNDWNFVSEDGPIAFVKWSRRSGIADSEEFSEAIFDVCYFEITSRYENAI